MNIKLHNYCWPSSWEGLFLLNQTEVDVLSQDPSPLSIKQKHCHIEASYKTHKGCSSLEKSSKHPILSLRKKPPTKRPIHSKSDDAVSIM